MNVNVLTNGKLTNGKITIKSQNINLSTALVEDNVIKQNYISDNTTEIELKDMTNGTQKLIYGTVKASNFGSDTNKYSQINSIEFTGTHVADDGTQTEIKKTVNFQVDWHSTPQTEIYKYSGTQDIGRVVDETAQEVKLQFYIISKETVKDIQLESADIEGVLPEINGYKATGITSTSSDIEIDFDQESGKFTATKKAVVNDYGNSFEYIHNCNLSFYYVPVGLPNVQERVTISNGQFRGNDALFEVEFDPGIESISIKREIYHDYMRYSYKPETKTIRLSDKESPYRFRYILDLFIGDNYIPITVTDKFGNSTNYTYKITMEEVKDDD